MAHTELFDAIAAAEAKVVGRDFSQTMNRRNGQLAAADTSVATSNTSMLRPVVASATPKTKKKQTHQRKRFDPRAESEEEAESSHAEEDSDFEPDEGSSDGGSIRGSPVPEVAPQGPPSKRSRVASSSKEDLFQPEKRPRAPKKTDPLGSELRLLETRFPNRSRLQEVGTAVDRQANAIIEQANAASKAIQERNRLEEEHAFYNNTADAEIKKIEADRKAYNSLVRPQIATHNNTIDAFVNANETAMQKLKQIVGKIVARGTTLLGVPR